MQWHLLLDRSCIIERSTLLLVIGHLRGGRISSRHAIWGPIILDEKQKFKVQDQRRNTGMRFWIGISGAQMVIKIGRFGYKEVLGIIDGLLDVQSVGSALPYY